jgi:hypothetical protein
VVALLLTVASPALAGTREKILQECQDGRLSGDYTAKEIRDARNNIPTDIDQYSDCRDVLSRALNDKAGGGGSGGGGGGAGGGGTGAGGGGGPLLTPSTPQDQSAIAQAQQHGADPVAVGGAPLTPGAAGLSSGAPRTSIPVEALVVLALLALAALGGTAPFARDRLGSIGTLATLPKRVFARGR